MSNNEEKRLLPPSERVRLSAGGYYDDKGNIIKIEKRKVYVYKDSKQWVVEIGQGKHFFSTIPLLFEFLLERVLIDTFPRKQEIERAVKEILRIHNKALKEIRGYHERV